MATPCWIGRTSDRQHRRDDEGEFGAAAPPDVDHRRDPHDAQRDEQQHAGERRVRHMREQAAAERRPARARGRRRRARRAARRRRSRRRPRCAAGWRRRGKAPMKAGEQIGRAEADEVAVDVGAAGRIGNEAARRRRGLHHDDERDDQRERRDLRQIGERDLRDQPNAASRPRSPRASRRRALRAPGRRPATVASASPISAPGKRGLRRSLASMIASTPRPMPSVGEIGLRRGAPASATTCATSEPLRRRDAEQRRRLADDDVAGDAGEKAGGDRDRQQIGDEAEAERRRRAPRIEADAERQRRRVGGVMRRAGSSPAAPARRRRSARWSNRRRPTSGG